MAEPDLDAPLTRAEFDALLEIAEEPVGHIIPHAHRARLLELRYLREGFGGLVVTSVGRLRLARGH